MSGNEPSEKPAASSSNPIEWLTNAIKKPFASLGNKREGNGAAKPRKKGFWQRTSNKLPGTVRQVRESTDGSDPPRVVRHASHVESKDANDPRPRNNTLPHPHQHQPPSHHPPSPPNRAGAASTTPPVPRQLSAPYNKPYPLYSKSSPNISALNPDGTPVGGGGGSSDPPSEYVSESQGGDDADGESKQQQRALPAQAPASPSNGAHDDVLVRSQDEDKDLGPPGETEMQAQARVATQHKQKMKKEKYLSLLGQPNIDMAALRSLAWSGVTPSLRATVWQLLLGYLPANLQRREQTVQRRRQEYVDYLNQYYFIDAAQRAEHEAAILRQIILDVPRTCPGYKFFQLPSVQKSLERILYIWAIRHPASGYVQGINDITTPYYIVFLSPLADVPVERIDDMIPYAERMTEQQYFDLEADTFWCLSKMIDSIQDHYIIDQPGIQRNVFKLQELINRIDSTLYAHLESQGLKFIQFAWRWMNCFLMREIQLPLIVRTWDTCLAEPHDQGFKTFHVYLCAAFLMTWAKELKTMDFQELIVFLQKPPTTNWGDKEIETMLSQAYVYQTLYHGAPKHLQ